MVTKKHVIGFRVDDEELARLTKLAGGQKIANFVLSSGFHVKRATGNMTEYPGWEIVERGRRDLGIKIARDPVPVGMRSPVILYPEDREYKRFSEI